VSGSADLLTRELIYVTGKGGVGKTTVAVALGILGARAGRRTVVCEVGSQHRIPALFGRTAAPDGRETEIADGLWSISIDPMRALEEWIGRQIGSRPTHILARSNAFQYFVAAAPGAREVVTLTKAWELGRSERWEKNAEPFDTVIVDAPASGHGIGMLRSPATIAGVARVGPVAGQAKAVQEVLVDPARSAYVAVTLPAELPVTETLELEGTLDAALGRGVDAIVCNAVRARRFDGKDLAAVAGVDGALPAPVRRAVVAHAGRVRDEQSQLRRLRRGSTVGVSTLPFVGETVLDATAIGALADGLGR
jgi:hypothetical protein